MRRMSRAEGQVEKERPLGHQRFGVANETYRAVDDILGHVIALFDRAGRIDEVIVGGQLGIELIGFSLQEAVVAIESALQRPVVQRTRRGAFRHRRQMPLSGGERRVTVVAQNLGQRRGGTGERAAHVGKAGVHVGDRAHPDRVMIASREQARARGRAQRGGVKAREAQATGGEPVDIGRLDSRAVAAEMRKAAVVEHDDHYVRRALRELRLRPPRFRLRDCATDNAAKFFARRMLVRHRLQTYPVANSVS